MTPSSSNALTTSPVISQGCSPTASPCRLPDSGAEQALIAEALKPTAPVSHQCSPLAVAVTQRACDSLDQHDPILGRILQVPQPWPASVRHLARRLCDSHREAQGSDRNHLAPSLTAVARHLKTLDELDSVAIQTDLTFDPPATTLHQDDAHASACGFLQLVPREEASRMDPTFQAWGDQERADAKARYNRLLQMMC